MVVARIVLVVRVVVLLVALAVMVVLVVVSCSECFDCLPHSHVGSALPLLRLAQIIEVPRQSQKRQHAFVTREYSFALRRIGTLSACVLVNLL